MDSTKPRKLFRLISPVYPQFNVYSYLAHLTTALGPVCVATAAREVPGWDVEVIDENNLRRHGPRAKDEGADHEFLEVERPADIVGLYGGLTSTIPRLYKLAKFYKARGIAVIAGGQHFVDDVVEDALANGIDYLVLGEAEQTIQELLPALARGGDLKNIKGLAYFENGKLIKTPAREPVTNFDLYPLPDFSRVRYSNITLYPVGRIRGCGMDCEFCTVKGKIRLASPERLMEQIKILLETREARHFFIVDDLFGQQRGETIRFCNMLRDYQKEIGVRLDFTVQIRLDKAKETDLLTAMREASINTIAIGFESPIEEELVAMKKTLSPQDMVEWARVFHDFGFLVHGMFIFGYPMKDGVVFKMEAAERVRRFKKFIKDAKVDTVQLLLPVPLPGTELTLRLKNQNRVYARDIIGWQYYDGNFPLFEPDPPLTSEEMQLSLRRIMGKFYRSRYMFALGFHIFLFPSILFFAHNIKLGWRKWYRNWRNSWVRFCGWMIMRGWTKQLRQGDFADKLKSARSEITR
jgi:radical SAM superfamily enzyme YgiQ (UPF0313 family)